MKRKKEWATYFTPGATTKDRELYGHFADRRHAQEQILSHTDGTCGQIHKGTFSIERIVTYR